MTFLHLLSVALGAVLLLGAAPAAQPEGAPLYDGNGRMLFPKDYRRWVFLSSGLNMSYSSPPGVAGHDMFGNTFAQPFAYDAFLKTGAWPDKTMIVLENRGGSGQGSINKRGTFQTTDYMGAEIHVKDAARFAGGWAFFAFGPAGEPAREIDHKADCYACHERHAAADTTFVQFYPTLLPAATKLGGLSASYLEESAPRK